MKNLKEKNEEVKIPLEKIKQVFNALPVDDILRIAKNIQERLKNDSTLAQKTKSEDESGWVTKADTDIQELILNYFANSPLTGTYNIKAEEKFTEEKSNIIKTWQLIVDPLDGTSEFRKGRDNWGVMVGACDNNGVLQYSWNLLSNGKIYSSENNETQNGLKSFSEKINNKEKLNIDVYNYGLEGTAEKFSKSFQEIFKQKENVCNQTSFPSAIWAGGQLSERKLDGLLWLPSELGKKWYPDYDLIFLGALSAQGFKIRIGKIGENNALIAIAPTEEDLELLYRVGLSMVPEDKKRDIRVSSNPLQITSKKL